MVQCNAGNAQTSDDFRGGGRPLPGRYHAIVNSGTEINSQDKGTPGTEIEFQILAGTVPGQEGTTLPETFWHTPKALDRLLAFAMACGALRPGENKDLTGPDYNGLQLVVEVGVRKYEVDGVKKETVEITYNGFWEVGHPEVKDVPKDQSALQQMQQVTQQPQQVQQPQQPPQPQQSQPVQQVPQEALAGQSPQPGPAGTTPIQTQPAVAPTQPAPGANPWAGVS